MIGAAQPLYRCANCKATHGSSSVALTRCKPGQVHRWEVFTKQEPAGCRYGDRSALPPKWKKPLKQHYRDASTPLTDSGVPTLCGVIVHVKYTTGRDSVTCRLCQQVLATGTHDFMETK